MPYPKFDRNKLDIKRLSDRKNKVYIERDHISADQAPRNMPDAAVALVEKTAERIKKPVSRTVR
jgi:hypothetical protein